MSTESAPPPRKVVQIVGIRGHSGTDCLHALLDDGSMWEKHLHGVGLDSRTIWYRVPGPPGTEPRRDDA